MHSTDQLLNVSTKNWSPSLFRLQQNLFSFPTPDCLFLTCFSQPFLRSLFGHRLKRFLKVSATMYAKKENLWHKVWSLGSTKPLRYHLSASLQHQSCHANVHAVTTSMYNLPTKLCFPFDLSMHACSTNVSPPTSTTDQRTTSVNQCSTNNCCAMYTTKINQAPTDQHPTSMARLEPLTKVWIPGAPLPC